MKSNYVSLSLETHLFFGRIMKEHALFLMTGFLEKDAEFTKRADWFRAQFEEILCRAVELGQGKVEESVLDSGELVTEFTLAAERKTSCLTGIEIDSSITEAEKELEHECSSAISRELFRQTRQLNRRALQLTGAFIGFKEKVLREMRDCQLFAFNYPLLVEHILREAGLYRSMVIELERRGGLSSQSMLEMEVFWNRIMMEHALFIRGLLDPTEETLIDTADEFADDYRRLLEEAKERDCMATDDLSRRTIVKTREYRDFKAAGTKGITECQIAGLILPLLADHVLREANHYLRLLEMSCVQ